MNCTCIRGDSFSSARSQSEQRLRRRQRRRQGATIAELAASMVILLPLIIVAGFVAMEAAQIYMIKNALSHCASLASRRLAIQYGMDPTGTMANPDNVFSKITFLGVVNDKQQFQIPSGTSGWNPNANPPSVTVVVTFKGGQYGCPDFPSPDPLNLGKNISFSATSTARLE